MDEEQTSHNLPARSSNKGLILAVVFAALVVSGSLIYLGMQMSNSGGQVANAPGAPAAAPPAPDPNIEADYDELVDDDAVLGDADAPLTLVEFSDYECPFCKRHFSQTLPQLISEYVETGKLKLVFRDFPLGFHQQALPAASAAECVRDQKGDEAYFEMHDKLFSGELSAEVFAGYAEELGVNMTEYNDCIDSGKFTDEINADMAAGGKFGVTGTPGFVLTDGDTFKSIKGAQPFASFKSQIEAMLK